MQCFSTFLYTKSKGFYALFLQKQSFSLHFLFLSPIESDIMNDKYNLISLLNPFLLISLLLSTPEPPKRKLWYSSLGFFVPFLKSKKIFMNTGLNKYQVIERKASALLSSALSSFFPQSAAVTINSLPCETNENSAAWVPGRNGLPKGSLDLIHCKYAQYSSSSIYRGPCSRFIPFPVKHKTFFSKKYPYPHICPTPPVKIPLYAWVAHL